MSMVHRTEQRLREFIDSIIRNRYIILCAAITYAVVVGKKNYEERLKAAFIVGCESIVYTHKKKKINLRLTHVQTLTS